MLDFLAIEICIWRNDMFSPLVRCQICIVSVHNLFAKTDECNRVTGDNHAPIQYMDLWRIIAENGYSRPRVPTTLVLERDVTSMLRRFLNCLYWIALADWIVSYWSGHSFCFSLWPLTPERRTKLCWCYTAVHEYHKASPLQTIRCRTVVNRFAKHWTVLSHDKVCLLIIELQWTVLVAAQDKTKYQAFPTCTDFAPLKCAVAHR